MQGRISSRHSNSKVQEIAMLRSLLLLATANVLALSCTPLSAREMKSLDCIHMLGFTCGHGGPVSFRVLVAADSKVSDVQPVAEHPSVEVKNAARCLAVHTDRLDPIIARSHAPAPFEFEFTISGIRCEDIELVQPH
jgi:hypothetical protein